MGRIASSQQVVAVLPLRGGSAALGITVIYTNLDRMLNTLLFG